MNRSTTIRPSEPLPEYSTRGGLFGMDMEAPQRMTELPAEEGEEEQSPEAQAVHTKKAPELPL